MAHLTNSQMPGYVIYRETRPGQPVDPTTPPVFFPPKDSDELFDALRAKFPHVKTHSERMRDAIIEFLLEERQAEQNPLSSAPASISNTEATSPWQQSWPSVSASTLSSPETMTAMTPMFSNSPQTTLQQQPPNMIRQFSTNNSVDCSEASPPALENMTTVFSLSSNEQPKQRIRRKMTEAEKVEYRKRRIVKACDKCSKRKRKCHHNQPDIDHVTAKSQKVTKPSSSSRKPTFEVPSPQTRMEATPLQLRDDQDLYGSWFDETQPMEDFTALLDIENANVDPFQQPDWLFSSNEEEWQWPKSGDFTLLDDFTPDLDWGMQSSSDSSSSQQSPSFVPTQPATPQSSFVASLEGSRSSLASSQLAAPSESSNGSGRLSSGSGSSGGSSAGFSTSNGNAMIWEHLRTGQQDASPSEDGEEGGMLWHNDPFFDESDNGPQHTYHAHAHTSSAAFMHDGAAGPSSGRAINAGVLRGYIAPHGTESSSSSESQHAALGSSRAGRTDGSLLDAQSPSPSLPAPTSTSQEVAPAALQSHGSIIRLDGRTTDSSSSSKSRSERATVAVDSPQQQPSHEDGRQAATAESIGGPLEIMQIRDYLRMKTNVSNIDSKGTASSAQLLGAQGQDVPLIEQIPRPPRRDGGGAQSGVGPAMNPAPGSSGEMLQQAHSSATARSSQGRQLASLGGTSLDGVASPDLYLLRRGIPSQQQARSQLQVRRPVAQRSVNANANANAAAANAAGPSPQLLKLQSPTPEQQQQQQLQVRGGNALLLMSPKPAHTRGRKPSASGFSNDNSNLIAQQDPRTQQQLIRLPLLDPSKISRMEMLLPTDKENLLQVRNISNKKVLCNSISATLRAAEGWMPDFFTCVALFAIFIGCGCHSTAGVTSVAPSVLLLALLCPTRSSSSSSSSSRSSGNAGRKSGWQAMRLPKVTSLLEEHKKKAFSPSLLGGGVVSSSSSPSGASWWKLALASVMST